MSAVLVAEFVIDGIPVQQGSKTAFVVAGKAVMTDQNAKTLKPWRAHVAKSARQAYGGPRIEGDVQLVLEFRMPRGKTVKRPRPSVTPDLDKLVRAFLDGLTDALTVWRDDAQVVTLLATKVYADRPGVRVQLGEYSNQPPTEAREQ